MRHFGTPPEVVWISLAPVAVRPVNLQAAPQTGASRTTQAHHAAIFFSSFKWLFLRLF